MKPFLKRSVVPGLGPACAPRLCLMVAFWSYDWLGCGARVDYICVHEVAGPSTGARLSEGDHRMTLRVDSTVLSANGVQAAPDVVMAMALAVIHYWRRIAWGTRMATRPRGKNATR